MADIKIDNDSIMEGDWSSVDKSELGRKLEESGDTSAIKEAYLYIGDIEKRSTWKFPHHALSGNTLKLHRKGVFAAAQRLVSGGETASDIPKSSAARHLIRHYRTMEEEIPESLADLAKSTPEDLQKEIEELENKLLYDYTVMNDEEIRELEDLIELNKEYLVDLENASLSEIIERKRLNLKERDGKVDKIVTLAMKKARTDEDYLPTEEQLEIINRDHAKTTLSKSQVRVFELQSADTDVDRGFEHFTKKALTNMAALAVKNKIPFLLEGDYDHQWRQKNTFGKVFDAKVEGKNLIYFAYIPVIEKTRSVLEAIMTGLYDKLSVGFSLDPKNYRCDVCNKSMMSTACPHIPGMMDEKTGKVVTVSILDVEDNYEISGVAVPMQPGAHIRQSSVSTQLDSNGTISLSLGENTIIDKINIGIGTGGINSMEVESTLENQENTENTEEVVTVELTLDKVAERLTKAISDLSEKVESVSSKVNEEKEVKVDLTEVKEEIVNSVIEVIKAQDEKINAVSEAVEKLQTLVDTLAKGSFKALLELVESSEQSEVAEVEEVEEDWIRGYLKSDIGGKK